MAEVVKMRGALGSSEDHFWRQLRGRVDEAVGGEELDLEEAEARMAIAGEEPVDPERVARLVHDVAALEAAEGVAARGRAPVRLLRMPWVRAAAIAMGVVLVVVAMKAFLPSKQPIDTASTLTYADAIEVLVDAQYEETDRQNAIGHIFASVFYHAVPCLKRAEADAPSAAARGQLAMVRAALSGPFQLQKLGLPTDLQAMATRLNGATLQQESDLRDVEMLGRAATQGIIALRHVGEIERPGDPIGAAVRHALEELKASLR